jgi:hypothetical protein
MLTDGFFRSRFGGDTRLVDRADGGGVLAGVLPASFELQFAAEASPDLPGGTICHHLHTY